MNDLEDRLQQQLRHGDDMNKALWSASVMLKDLQLVKYIVENKDVDLSHRHQCNKSLIYEKKEKYKCIAMIVKADLDQAVKTYHDDEHFEMIDDPYDLWEGDGSRKRNELFKEIQNLEELYHYLRDKTKTDFPELLVD